MSKEKYVIVNPKTKKERAVSRNKILDPMGDVQVRMDGWQNVITGLGTARDKRVGNQVNWAQHSQEFYEQLYSGDELASRIVDVVPEEALRKWIEFTGEDKKILTAIEKKCEELDLRGSCERAWKWARQTGGSLQYIVTDTDNPAGPLKIGENVLGLREMSRYDLRILTTDIETDFGSANFGNPNIYYLNVQVGTNVKLYPIHWTRCIRYDGKLVPRRTYIRNNYWHDSELQRLYNVIRNYQSSNDAAANILQDFNVGVYKMKNLTNWISAGKESLVKNRIELLNYTKSSINAMILDTDDEDFVDVSRNLTGLAEMLEHQAKRFVAATDIPHTKLLGESPDGSNATGNSTTQMWYEHIEGTQNNYLKPRLDKLFGVLFYDIPGLTYKFKPLAKLTDLEEADLRNKQAQTDQIYLDHGVLDASEVTESRFGGDVYSSETKIDREGRAAGLIVPGGDDDPNDPNQGPGSGGNGGSDFTPLSQDKPDVTAKSKNSASAKEMQKDSEVDPGQPESSNIDEKLPASLMPHAPNPNGVETASTPNQWNLQNNEIPSHVNKVQPFISQTMSEPMRDPRTDPKLKPPGLPNKPREIDWVEKYSASKDSGISSVSTRKDAGESAFMPRQLDYTKKKVDSTTEAACIIPYSENKVLLGRKRESGKWTFPGGHVEPGEDAEAGAERELLEETGIQSNALKFINAHNVINEYGEPVIVSVYAVEVDSGTQATNANDPDNEIMEWKWIDMSNGLPADIANNMHHNPNVALEDLELIYE